MRCGLAADPQSGRGLASARTRRGGQLGKQLRDDGAQLAMGVVLKPSSTSSRSLPCLDQQSQQPQRHHDVPVIAVECVVVEAVLSAEETPSISLPR